jgi:hypothetical protein
MNEAQIPDILATLARLAPVVEAQHGALVAAIDEEATAEAALLERVVELVRPALKALSSRLKAGERVWWPTSTETASEKTYHEEHGILVDGTGPERDFPRANDGAISGQDLALLEDGTFAVLDWSGNWARWQGRSSEEHSTLTRLPVADVLVGWDVETIARALVDRLERHAAGKAPTTTRTAADRAEKLRAVVALLGVRS